MSSNRKLKELLAKREIARRQEEVIPDVLQECLPHQREFILNPSRRKAVCGTRRSAKSYALGIYLIHICLTVPKAKVVYIGLTNESVRTIMWSAILERVILKYKIKASLNSKLEIEFPNGSIIYLRGFDATPHQMNRLRGNAYDLAVLDELQSAGQDIRDLIDGVLKMTLAQSQGTLCLAGTPGSKLGKHFWWEVNRPDSTEVGWTRFSFGWKDNTSIEPKNGMRVCDAVQLDIDAELALDPYAAGTPRFRREWGGEWVIETDSRVYQVSSFNYISKLPDGFLNNAAFILGVDLGYDPDPTAFVITAYNKRYNDKLYVLESFKKPKLTVDLVAKEIKQLRARFRFRSLYIDAGAQGKMIVETMRAMYQLPLQGAEKHGKHAHQNVLNSDLNSGNVFIIKPENEDLIDELETLIWDPKLLLEGDRKEHSNMPNHLCDALLYAHHGGRHYWFRPKDEPLPPEEQILLQIEDQFQEKERKMKQLTVPFWVNEERDNGY